MGGFIGGGSPAPQPMPAPDTSYLEETRKQKAEEKAKNEARLRAIRARSGSGGAYGLLEFAPAQGGAAQLSDRLGA